MRSLVTFTVILIVSVSMGSCTLSTQRTSNVSIVWDSDESVGLSPTNDGAQRMISVPLDPKHLKDGYFSLYYFARPPTGRGFAKKTVLFVAGGPGNLVQFRADKPDNNETFADFLRHNDYNVVFFHLRGSGYSQIPAGNEFDRFLRTSFAVEDIEEIRKDFMGKVLGKDGPGKHAQWDAIIGWSYGTVLAQQYASQYSDKVKKLVLLGPLSRHMFAGSADAINTFKEINNRAWKIQRETLEKIYLSETFNSLGKDTRITIIDEVFGKVDDPGGIFAQTEKAFGTIQFVVDNYCTLKQQGKLQDGLGKYSRQFFQELRRIRQLGWFPSSSTTTDQDRIGQVIRDEVLDETNVSRGEDKCEERDHADRAFYVINNYDGIDLRFLREWLTGDKKDFAGALKRSAGESGANEQIKKVGIADDVNNIVPWDPAEPKYRHNLPTLILKGGSDPVDAGDAANHIYSKALEGQRTFIDFSGIGHMFLLPGNSNEKPRFSGTVRLEHRKIPPGESRCVKGILAGPSLDERLKIKLEFPAKSDLEVVCVGITGQEKNDENKSENEIEKKKSETNGNIIALLKKTGNEVNENSWNVKIKNHFFGGEVSLKSLGASPTQIFEASGFISKGWQNPDRVVRLTPEANPNSNLELLCSKIDVTGGIHVFFRNNHPSEVIPSQPLKWTLTRGSDVRRITLGPEVMPNDMNVAVIPPDLKFEPHEKFDFKGSAPNLTVFCHRNPEEGSTEVRFFMGSGEETLDGTVEKHITLDNNPYFTANFSVKPKLKSGKPDWVTASLEHGVNWKKWIELEMPRGLDRNLALRGVNIVGADKIDLLIQNVGDYPIDVGTRMIDEGDSNWYYTDPMNNTGACNSSGPVRDCLIYSFLIMDFADFENAKRIFDSTRESFKVKKVNEPNGQESAVLIDESQSVIIKHCDPEAFCDTQK